MKSLQNSCVSSDRLTVCCGGKVRLVENFKGRSLARTNSLPSTPLRSPLAKSHTGSYEQLQYMNKRKQSSEINIPCRPAACTIEAISADDNRSGRETSVNVK